ncbi:MAG: transporter substrate-binding domain-containing protein [Chloroflexi bacterium]|nr:transporter substrate-binding domain-containing protein [Chloroflexota bacterium]
MTTIQTITPGTLTVGSYTAFAPVSWHDGTAACGKDIDFLQAFAARWNLQVVVRFFPFDRIWERPARAEIDIAAAGIAPLANRTTPGVVWSEPYYTVQRSLLIRATDRAKQTIADFAGQTIAVTRGSTADLDTEQRKPATTRVVYREDQVVAVKDLLNHTIDAFAEGDICSHYMAARYPGQLAVVDVHPMEPAEQFVFAVREVSGLLEPLNRFIREESARY